MQDWISHLNDPLVLGGFVLAIFAGVFKFMLGKKGSSALLNRGLNFLFALAVLVVGLAFFKTERTPPANTPAAAATPASTAASALVVAPVSAPMSASAPAPTTIKQSTQGHNSAARIEGVKLNNKNVDQSTRGNNSPAIIKGDGGQ